MSDSLRRLEHDGLVRLVHQLKRRVERLEALQRACPSCRKPKKWRHEVIMDLPLQKVD